MLIKRLEIYGGKTTEKGIVKTNQIVTYYLFGVIPIYQNEVHCATGLWTEYFGKRDAKAALATKEAIIEARNALESEQA